jgi:LemA protein
MNPLWIILIVVAVIVLWVIFAFNSLIRLKNHIDNAWSQIDVQLKRRYDLIPNLINTVKGYMKHEKNVITEVTKARTAMMSAKNLSSKAKAEDSMSGALKTIFALAENYPNLKANENFKLLQEELSGTESKIAYARQFYNDSVMTFNIQIETFPTKIIAGMLGFTKKREFFKTESEAERKNVKVDFD